MHRFANPLRYQRIADGILAWAAGLAVVLGVIGLYLAAVTAFGSWMGRRGSVRDYMLAGQDVPAWAVALPVGFALRAATGRGLGFGFLIVTVVFTAATLLGWRLLAAAVRRRAAARV